MAMEASVFGSGFKNTILEISLGDLPAKLVEYIESRAKLKREAREETVDDLCFALKIVNALTSQYIDLMQAFSAQEVISDYHLLDATIKAAEDYLRRRELLPHLDMLTGYIHGRTSLIDPTGWALRNVHKDLLAFRKSLLGVSSELGLPTGVGVDALRSRITMAKELLQKGSPDLELQQFMAATEQMLDMTNVSASERVSVSIGRAIGKLQG